MDPDLGGLVWDDVFDDELAALLAQAPSLPTLLPPEPLAFEAGVSTPDQHISAPAASHRLSAQFQHHSGPSSDALPPTSAVPAVSIPKNPSPCGLALPRDELLSAAFPDAPACEARRPHSSLLRPATHVRSAQGGPAIVQAPSSREAPCGQGIKRHKVDAKEERRRQQNKKDQQAYRARNKVRHRPPFGCASSAQLRMHAQLGQRVSVATRDEIV